MPTITTPCKLCGKPATAVFDADAPEDAVNKWLPMVAHNHCADRTRKRNDAGAAITDAAFRYSRMTPDAKGKTLHVTRERLLLHTKRYAEAICAQVGLPYVMWTEQFADIILEQPTNVSKVLSNYRESIRQKAREEAK